MLDTGCSKVVASCYTMLSALGLGGRDESLDITVCVHACANPQCCYRPSNCYHANAYLVLDEAESRDHRAAWTRVSSTQAVVNEIKEAFHVKIPLNLPGIEMEDMFVDVKTKRRFYYPPKANSVHVKDRKSGDSHHSIDDCEQWRCGFYILQTVWLRCASVAFAGEVPSDGKLQSRYLPNPNWKPGKSNTIMCSHFFAHSHTKLYVTDYGLRGVEAKEHRVVNVQDLIKTVQSFIVHKHQGKTRDLFGWNNFSMTKKQILQAACEVGKIVSQNLGYLTFAW